MTPKKPVLLYDGSCGMCRRGVSWLRKKITADGVDYLSTADPKVCSQFPELTLHNQTRQMVFIKPNGHVFGGARAIAQMLCLSPRFRPLGRILDFPLVRPFAAVGYRILAFLRQI